MSRIELESKVGPDGVLAVEIPLGVAEANKRVRVVVEPLNVAAARDAWLRFIEETAGSITDSTFTRQPQGDYEKREVLD